MNSSVKAIEWFEPMAPVESSKKQNAFSGWWHRVGSHHHGQSFCPPAPPLFLPRFLMWFCFCDHVQRVWLIHNRTVPLCKTKLFQHDHVCQNYRTFFVKKNIWWYHFWIQCNACEQQLLHLLVFSCLVFRRYIICKEIYSQRNLKPLVTISLFLNFEMGIMEKSYWVTFFP